MLYILIAGGKPAVLTVSHTEAQQLFSDASKDASPTDAIRLVQIQADVIQERVPPPKADPNNPPLSDAEKAVLASLLARAKANSSKGGG